ncbi:MAG: TIGR02281 family clan AA aspartic protease [Boseongicola sp.]|nr:TIGR02281 family clan AA aspartic protease [Boseongicola sp.]NNL18899.1 TIGR02281 family clan AA aspartic protease [Boseongicola sp.]
MNNLDLDSLIYLTILGAAVLGWFIAENRSGLGKIARMMIAWSLIFVGFIGAYGLWEDIEDELLPSQAVVEEGAAIAIPRSFDGHFHLTLQINGAPVDFLVDTGATDIVLTMEDAERVGLNADNLAFIGRARTANGEVRTAFAELETVELGPFFHQNIPVSINEGEMPGSLLGMRYLSLFDRIEISGDQMTLRP